MTQNSALAMMTAQDQDDPSIQAKSDAAKLNSTLVNSLLMAYIFKTFAQNSNVGAKHSEPIASIAPSISAEINNQAIVPVSEVYTHAPQSKKFSINQKTSAVKASSFFEELFKTDTTIQNELFILAKKIHTKHKNQELILESDLNTFKSLWDQLRRSYNYNWLDCILYPFKMKYDRKKFKDLLRKKPYKLSTIIHPDRYSGNHRHAESNAKMATEMFKYASIKDLSRPAQFLDPAISSGVDLVSEIASIKILSFIYKIFPNLFENQKILDSSTNEIINAQEKIKLYSRTADQKKEAIKIKAQQLKTAIKYFQKK